MPTIRQKRVAKAIIENVKLDNPKTGGEIVESSGYGVSMKKNPQVVLNSDGVQEALEDYGFTEDNAKRVVQEILLDEEVEANSRLKAADMVFKVKGTYAPEKSVNLNIVQEPSDKVKKLTDELRRIQQGGNNSGN
jgi:hypothetical protein